jgi:hypothetical protein
MEKRQLIPTLIPTILIGVVSALAWGILSGMLVSFMSFIVIYIIVGKMIYGKRYGDKVIPFATDIVDENMEPLARFKETDWQLLRKPSEVVEIEQAKVTEMIEKSKLEKKKEKEVIINYSLLYKESRDKFWRNLFPNSPDLDVIIANLSGDFYEDIKTFYDLLPTNGRNLLAKTIRAVVDNQISPKDPPKLWEISSLSAGVILDFFAQNEPAVYQSYRTSTKFKKWRVMPWFGGFPVVKMWGHSIGLKTEVEGVLLNHLIAFPVEDEYLMKQRALNLAKFSIPAEALSLYAQNFMYLYPYVTDLESVKTQKTLLMVSWQKILNSLPEFEEIIGELSDRAFSAQRMVMQLSGLITEAEEIPEDIKAIAKRYKEQVEKEQKEVEKTSLRSKLSLKALTKRPPEITAPPPTVPIEKSEEE